MSKIAITGHMSGLGKSLFDKLSIDHTVIGYDIKIGHDLNTCCDDILASLDDVDIFINNAFCDDKQIYLFDEWYNKYKNHKKTIINMNSLSRYTRQMPNKKFKDYVVYKKELDKHTKAVLSHSDRLCRVVSVSPTWLTNSELVNPPSGAKLLNVDDVSDIIIDMVVEKPQHIELSELTINTLC
jgi:hypothetical protein